MASLTDPWGSISDTLEELAESGQTFSSDLDRFRGACAALKKALGPIQRLTKREVCPSFSCLNLFVGRFSP